MPEPEKGGPIIIDTIKIRRGDKDVFVPMNPKGQPFTKENPPEEPLEPHKGGNVDVRV